MSTSGSANYVLLTCLADEFAARYRAGERPALQEYLDRYPELADDIRELFPAMVEMEQVKEDHEEAHEQTAAPPAPALQQLGDFRILREVGKGGMGIVYEAEQVSLGRHVALKVVPRSLLLDARAKRRFEREAKAAARLHHTNIVPVFGVGEQDGLPYYVMQFIQGLGLDQVLDELRKLQPAIARSGPLTPGEIRVSRKELAPAQLARSLLTGDFVCQEDPPAEEAAARIEDTVGNERGPAESPHPSPLSDSLTPSSSSVVLPGQGRVGSRSKSGKPTYWKSVAAVGVQVAEALAYAHQQGVQHRDIKPSNLLLDTQARVWITDFGLAKADDQQNLTHTGDLLGTLRYMPPEAFEGKTDVRSDVYSLGLTLYELLAFRPAFEERDRNRLIKQVTTGEPPRLNKLNREMPRDLVTIIHKAMEREPGQRYQTAADLAADLQRFIEDEPIQARRASVAERAWRWCKRNPVVAALLSLVAFMLVSSAVGAGLWAVSADGSAEREKAAAERERDAAQFAHQQADLATREADRSRRLLYASDMNLALHAWEVGDNGQARALLERQWPQAGQDDLRGFEWRYLWRLCGDGSRQTLRGQMGEVGAIAFAPDGKTLAASSAGSDPSVCLWDLASGRHVKLVGYRVNSVAFAPDGKTLAIAEWHSRAVRLWDVDARRQRASFPLESGVMCAAFSPDGKLLAAGEWNGTVRTWDVAARREVGTLAGHIGPVTQVVFAPDGKTLASGSADTSVRLWDVAGRRALASLEGHTAEVVSLAFSPDGKTLASAGEDSTVRLWDPFSRRVAKTLRGQSTAALSSVAFSSDGKTLATGGGDGTVRLWDAGTKQLVALLRGHTAPVMAVAFAPDSRSLVSGSRDGTVKVWDVATRPQPNTLTGHKGYVSSVAFSPDGKTLAVANTREQTVTLWDVTSRQRDAVLTGHTRPVWCVSFAPGGQTLASTDVDGTIRLWDVATKKCLADLQTGFKGWVKSAAFSPDGKLLAAGIQGGQEILVWDVAARRKVRQLASGNTVAFSPDGTLLAVSSVNTLRLWDVVTWQTVADFTVQAAEILCFAFARDGRTLATGDSAGTLRLWDVARKREVGSRRGHTSNVRALAFSPDGRRLATGGGVAASSSGTSPRSRR
jgi:WD40 repeat protein/serine/threonine protein kinase